MADHTLTVQVKTQQTSAQTVGQAQAEASGGRQSSSAAARLQITQAISLGKMVSSLNQTSKALKTFGDTLNKLIPDLAQFAGLKAGVHAGTKFASSAAKGAAAGAIVGSVIPGVGTLVGGALGAAAGGGTALVELNAEQKEETKKLDEEKKKKRKEDEKARRQYVFEGELTDFKSAGREQQLETLKKWSAELNNLKQAEVKAREDLAQGGSVEQYEAVQKQLEQAESRLNAAEVEYEAGAPVPDSVETKQVNFMDNMSKMGLYMTGGFAAGQGNVEIQVLKEQKDILKKIEKNTENTAATYS